MIESSWTLKSIGLREKNVEEGQLCEWSLKRAEIQQKQAPKKTHLSLVLLSSVSMETKAGLAKMG